MKKKLKNYGLWMSVIGCIILFIQALGLNVDIPILKEALIGVCGVLVTLGLISNPSKGKGYNLKDKEKDS